MSVTTTPTSPTTVPASQVIPFPMPWGSGAPCPPPLPGCCPPGGMDALMKCYCDIQAAQAFICQMMINCVEQNPAVTAAIIAAIEKSGSSVPLIGVTNGVAAQPGQVGEYIQIFQNFTVPVAEQLNLPVTIGVLQPGDWDVWAWLELGEFVTDAQFLLNPQPAGFSSNLFSIIATTAGEAVTVMSNVGQALISVPSLINFSVSTNTIGQGGSAAGATLFFAARRAR